MAKPRITVTLDKVPEVLAAIRRLTEERVYVGIPQGTGAHGEMDNATLGFIHENGSPARNIPARPTLVPGVAKVKDQVAEELKAGAMAVLKGRPDAVLTSYNRAGIIARDSVKGIIRTSDGLAPLAESTLHARKTRKRAPRKGERPLLDTGQFMNAVTYVIKKYGTN